MSPKRAKRANELPYELAWSCVIIEVFMYMLHGWLGDPVVPGWITPTLPFTLAYLNGFEKGPERIQAMIALQLLVAFIFIFMGITKLADKFVNGVPNSIKGGILIAAPITVLQGQLSDGSQLMTAPFPPLAGPLWVGMTVSVAMRYKEGKKAMKSLIGGMSSFRMATFLSVILVPIVSFMKPIMGVGSAITLLFQAYVCARIGMEYCKTSTDKSIAGVMAAVLAFKGSGWALVVGFAMNLMLSNMEFQKRKLGLVDAENVDQIETKDNEPS